MKLSMCNLIMITPLRNCLVQKKWYKRLNHWEPIAYQTQLLIIMIKVQVKSNMFQEYQVVLNDTYYFDII